MTTQEKQAEHKVKKKFNPNLKQNAIRSDYIIK